MKNDFPQLTLLGSNSGNNVGDAAILSAILESVTRELPTAQFLVPTTNPQFTNEKYGKKYRVKALDIMPWNLSFRFLGLPTLKCFWKSDVALICDGIIFGKRLFNPTFNLLITLAPLVFVSKLTGCKLVCYSCGIGPFPKGRGSLLARFLIQNCSLIMMRDDTSKRLAEELGVTKAIELTGDAAFRNPVSSAARASEIIKQKQIDLSRPLFGINVTSYIDTWVNEDGRQSDGDAFLAIMTEGIAKARQQTGLAFNPVIFSTHPMDEQFAIRLGQALDAPVISNVEYLSHDMQAVMQHCSLFLGMRFHSLVLASAVSAPVMALVYAPKVGALMKEYDSSEFALAISSLDSSSLSEKIVRAWNERDELRARQQRNVDRFKSGADLAAHRLAEEFFPQQLEQLNSKAAA